MDHPPAASTTDARRAMHRRRDPILMPPVTISGYCELALACFGLLRHNSMATWRQLPGGGDADDETCPIYCRPPSAIVRLASQTGYPRNPAIGRPSAVSRTI